MPWTVCRASPRRHVRYRDADFTELDLAAVLERHPAVALVDELAHTNVPGSGPHERRWQDVDAMLDAGIDVISTLNIQHLESLNDVVSQITGVPQRETVPDSVVRAADQIELVDMSPEALRKRMAHGNVYPPERVDAALGNYFRVGNLTALRELALLWLADRVEEGMQRYRSQHGITGTWETKERIVVALTGGPEGETLIRRASRIAARTAGGELLAVHVARNDGLSGTRRGRARRSAPARRVARRHVPLGRRRLRPRGPARLRAARGRDADRARHVPAQPARRRVQRPGHRRDRHAVVRATSTSTSSRTNRPVDVGRGCRRLTRGLTTRRRLWGLLLAAVLLPLLTLVCTAARGTLGFGADLPLYLLVVVLTSLVGGFYPALLSAVAGSLLLNYFFVEPLHTFTISEPSNLVAVLIFLLIAVLVSQVVDLAARRSVQAARAGAEAETLSTFAGSLLRGEQALPALLDRTRESFAMDSAGLLRRDPSGRGWSVEASAGQNPPANPGDADAEVSVGDDLRLALRGRPLSAGRPAHPGCVRGQRGRRLPPARARRGRPRRRAARRVRPAADGAAQRRQPRPAHADRVGQGGGVQPARGRGALGRGRPP